MWRSLPMQSTFCTRARRKCRRPPRWISIWPSGVTVRLRHWRRKQVMAKINESSGNIFLDLGFSPHEAAVLLLRAELAEALRQWMESEGITQTQAAKRLGIRSEEHTSELQSRQYLVCRL